MPDRLVIEIDAEARVSVSTWREGEVPDPPLGPFELEWPLDEEALEELRWYLEDYLRVPFGVHDEDRARKVAGSLEPWGRAVFAALFAEGPARDAYSVLRAGGGQVELLFRSSLPGALALPWELMCDPAGPVPLALDLVDIARGLPPGGGQQQATELVAGERLRMLMVISRPAGARDVGYQMIARPLLRRLQAVSGNVELVVLRPPTFEAFKELLGRARDEGQPFQIVHFDGHGALRGAPVVPQGAGVPQNVRAAGGEGVLVFEAPEGGEHPVSAADIAQALKAGQVPIAILNAGQSGAVGKQLEAAVATRLLAEGAAAVVAMAYSVYAVAAAEFMATFYEGLFAGRSVAESVGAGRQRLHQKDGRSSPKGELPLADWIVPVHYLRAPVRFSQLAREPERRPEGISLDAALDALRQQGPEEQGDLEPVDDFVGRDALFYELEVAARHRRAIILHGPGGTGKTELAKAFGRWWRDTGALDAPNGVIFHSFEPGVASFGLDSLIGAIGLGLFGADFARLDDSDKQALIEQTLAQHRLLVILDNFESAHSMSDSTAATPALDERERERLAAFIRTVAAGGKSAMIITTRSPEPWLGELRRIELGGLDPDEAIRYADQLLAPYPESWPRRQQPAFADLLQWLDGHPLSMRLVLPHLKDTDAGPLLEALRTSDLAVEAGEGRQGGLEDSMGFFFSHLSADVQRLFPVLSLFSSVADADVLGAFSAAPEVPERFAGVSSEQWAQHLDAGASGGLLTPLGAGMYRMHPVLSGHLARRWRDEEGTGYKRQRHQAESALLTAYAAVAGWALGQIDSGNAQLAVAVIDLQRRTLGHMLGLALEAGRWAQAGQIAQALNAYFDLRGLPEEARAWVERARGLLEAPDGSPPDLESDAGALWLFLVGTEAMRSIGAGHLESAEATYLEILQKLEAAPDSERVRVQLGIAYGQLGTVAQWQGHLDEAQDWYTRSLHIAEAFGDRPRLATIYGQLGTVAQLRGQLDEAQDWYTRSLHIAEALGDRPRLATIYGQLGTAAQLRGQLDEAQDWYTRSLAIREVLGDRPGQALPYSQLGRVAQLRGQLDEAQDWYTRSLHIAEELGDRLGMTTSYHQLGGVAQDRGRLEEAEDWYRRSLHIAEELGDRPRLATLYGQLGTVAQEHGRLEEAEDWYTRSLHIAEELGDRLGMTTSYDQLGRVAQDRGQLDQAQDWYTRSLHMAEEFGDRPRLATLYGQLGTVAQEHGLLEEAEDWYRRSLHIAEELGDRPRLATNYGQLGLLAEERGEPGTALEWIVRCVALFEQFPHPATGPGPYHMKRLTGQLGLGALEQIWQGTTSQHLPVPVREFVTSD